MKQSAAVMTLTFKIDFKVSWATAIKMLLMGRHPAAMIAKALADRIRKGE